MFSTAAVFLAYSAPSCAFQGTTTSLLGKDACRTGNLSRSCSIVGQMLGNYLLNVFTAEPQLSSLLSYPWLFAFIKMRFAILLKVTLPVSWGFLDTTMYTPAIVVLCFSSFRHSTTYKTDGSVLHRNALLLWMSNYHALGSGLCNSYRWIIFSDWFLCIIVCIICANEFYYSMFTKTIKKKNKRINIELQNFELKKPKIKMVKFDE